MTIQIKATEQYFLVVLFVILYMVAQTGFQAVDEILKFDYSNESYHEVIRLWYKVILAYEVCS